MLQMQENHDYKVVPPSSYFHPYESNGGYAFLQLKVIFSLLLVNITSKTRVNQQKFIFFFS